MAPCPPTPSSTSRPRTRIRRNVSTNAMSTNGPSIAARVDPESIVMPRPRSPSAGSAVSAPPSASQRYSSSSVRSVPAGRSTPNARPRIGPLFQSPGNAPVRPRPAPTSSNPSSSPAASATQPPRAKVDSSFFADVPRPPRASPSSLGSAYGMTSPPGSAVSATSPIHRPAGVRKVHSSSNVMRSPGPPSQWMSRQGTTSPGPTIAQAHVHPSLSQPQSHPHSCQPPPQSPSATPTPTSPLGPLSQADLSHITFSRGSRGGGHRRSSSANPTPIRLRDQSQSPSLPPLDYTPPSPSSSLLTKQRLVASPEPESQLGALESVSEVWEPGYTPRPMSSLSSSLSSRSGRMEAREGKVDAATFKLEQEAKKDRKILDLEISNRSLLTINEALEVTKLQQSHEIRTLKRRLRFLERHGLLDGGLSYDANGTEVDHEDSGSEQDISGSETGTHTERDNPLTFEEDTVLAALNLRCKKLIEDMTVRARAALAFEPSKSHVGTGGKVLHPAEVAALAAETSLVESCDDPSASTSASFDPKSDPMGNDDPSPDASNISSLENLDPDTSTYDTDVNTSNVSDSIPRILARVPQHTILQPSSAGNVPPSESDPDTSTYDTDADTANVSDYIPRIPARAPEHTILAPRIALRQSTPPVQIQSQRLRSNGPLNMMGDDLDDNTGMSVNGGKSSLLPSRHEPTKPRLSVADISID